MATKRILGWMVIGALGVLAVLLARGNVIYAQGPLCPPGFVWQPNSGVGCVQENCGTIAGSKPSYTSQCICQEGFQACYKGVDYNKFDSTLCGPFCPNSALTSCIDPKSECPKDELNPGLASPGSQDNDSASENTDSPAGGPVEDAGPSIEEMTRFLEEALIPKSTGHPSRVQAAAGGVAAGLALLVMMVVMMSSSEGPPLDKIVETILLDSQEIITGFKPKSDQPQQTPENYLKPDGENIEKLKQSALESAQIPKSTVTTQKLIALQNEFHQIVNKKVKDGYYVMNKDAMSKIWNWTVGMIRDPLFKLEGGQCGEMAFMGQGWVENFVMKNFGREAIIDQVFIYERSSRYPQTYRDYADALYASNHAATRVILPNGDSFILDFWEAIAERQGKGEGVALQTRIVPENEWIMKWKGNIGSPNDPAEVSNVNVKQAEFRNYMQRAGAIHPTQASYLPPDQYEKALQVTRSAIDQWRLSRNKISPTETEMLINNWKKYGTMWEAERIDPPGGPGEAFWDGKKIVVDRAKDWAKKTFQ